MKAIYTSVILYNCWN